MSVCTNTRTHRRTASARTNTHTHTHTHTHTYKLHQPACTLFHAHTRTHTHARTHTQLPRYILSELFVWTVSHIAKYGEVGEITLNAGSATSAMTQAAPWKLCPWPSCIASAFPSHVHYNFAPCGGKKRGEKKNNPLRQLIQQPNLKVTVRGGL